MDNHIVTPDWKSQEKIAAVLSYFLFFLPVIMEQKTDFTTFHMRQSFLLLLVNICAVFIPILWGLVMFVVFLHILFLAWKAYGGEKYAVPYIYNHANTVIKALGIDNFFTPAR